MWVNVSSTSMTSALSRRPSLRPSRVTSSSPPAPPPTTIILVLLDRLLSIFVRSSDWLRCHRLSQSSAHRLIQLRDDLEQIAHQAEVGDLEDRRLRVLVDGDNRAGVLDPGQVLEGAGDAKAHVQIRRDDLAGLADLHVVGHIAGIDRGTRGADPGADLVGKVVDELEVLFAADPAPAGDDLGGGLQVGAIAFLLFDA